MKKMSNAIKISKWFMLDYVDSTEVSKNLSRSLDAVLK